VKDFKETGLAAVWPEFALRQWTNISRWTRGSRVREAKKFSGEAGPAPSDDLGNPTATFRGEPRSNETHDSKSDPEAQHPDYPLTQRKRNRIEECFGRLKTIALWKVRRRRVWQVECILPSPARRTTWRACGIWPWQLRRRKFGPDGASSSMKLTQRSQEHPTNQSSQHQQPRHQQTAVSPINFVST
jgi:hypothetical protein